MKKRNAELIIYIIMEIAIFVSIGFHVSLHPLFYALLIVASLFMLNKQAEILAYRAYLKVGRKYHEQRANYLTLLGENDRLKKTIDRLNKEKQNG